MKNFWLTTLSLIVATAIGANVAMLFQFGERLTRIETKLEILVGQPHYAKQQ
jgi:ABC-type uncharacterized transport system YnjBCD permease subunit